MTTKFFLNFDYTHYVTTKNSIGNCCTDVNQAQKSCIYVNNHVNSTSNLGTKYLEPSKHNQSVKPVIIIVIPENHENQF